MKQIYKLVLAALACVVLIGCAHPINMKPDLDRVNAFSAKRINKQVGYHMSEANLALEVITPGGGGDKVRYFPYLDMEPGFYKALSEVFSNVSKIKNPKDAEEMRKSGIAILIVPEISTTSSSPSLFTWPPTQFTITLAGTITDATGQLVRKFSVTGEGKAEFDEFRGNFSLSATRASNDVFAKLMKELGE